MVQTAKNQWTTNWTNWIFHQWFFLANGSYGELMDGLVCEVEGIDKKLRAES